MLLSLDIINEIKGYCKFVIQKEEMLGVDSRKFLTHGYREASLSPSSLPSFFLVNDWGNLL